MKPLFDLSSSGRTSRWAAAFVFLGALGLVQGCFSPDKPKCLFQCGASEPACPNDYECRSDNYCHLTSAPAGEVCDFPAPVDAAVSVDGTVDGSDGSVTPDGSNDLLVVTPATLAITEGAIGSTFSVALASAPTQDVDVTISSNDTGAATTSVSSLRFTPANFASPQIVTVTAVDDVDVANETVIVSIAAPDSTTRALSVTITDDDVLQIATSVPTVNVQEGATTQIGVHLSHRPSANVVVAVGLSDTTSLSASTTSLTFTAANYSVDQVVMLTGVEDSDQNSEVVTLTFSSTSVATPTTALANISDNDVVTIVTSVPSLALQEGQSTSFSVSLASAPTADVTLNITSSHPTEVHLTQDPLVLTFTPINFATPQTVMVTAQQDTNAADVTATLNIVDSAGTLTPTSVSVSVDDDETLSITLSSSAVTVAEGQTTMVTVRLTAEPTAPVAIALASTSTTSVTVAPASLTLNSTNYTTGLAFTITAVEDPNASTDVVSVRANGPIGSGLAQQTVTVTATDNDTQSLTVTPGLLTVTELVDVTATNTATFTVRLAAQPDSLTTLSLNQGTPTGHLSVSPAMLAFTPLNYATPQTVTVTATDDVDTVSELVTIAITSPGLMGSAQVQLVDDDLLSSVPSTISLAEGSTAPLAFALSGDPGASPLSVSASSASAAIATVSATALAFSSANYMVPQSFTVTGTSNPSMTNQSTTITVSAPKQLSRTVTVTVTNTM